MFFHVDASGYRFSEWNAPRQECLLVKRLRTFFATQMLDEFQKQDVCVLCLCACRRTMGLRAISFAVILRMRMRRSLSVWAVRRGQEDRSRYIKFLRKSQIPPKGSFTNTNVTEFHHTNILHNPLATIQSIF
jgi:hypothetical protein